MEAYFEVQKGSQLYNNYFQFVEDYQKVGKAFKTVKDAYGIETHEFYSRKDTFHICPTENDYQKFGDQMLKNDYGAFKKTAPISRYWQSLVAEIKFMTKPKLFYYINFTGRWSEQLFHIGDKVYGSLKTTTADKITLPDFFIPMKASEFYRVIEEDDVRRALQEEAEEESETAPTMTM